MKKSRKIIIAIVVVVLVVAAWLLFFRKEDKQVVVQTEKPKMGYISESVTATGTVQPEDTVAVGTQVSGTLQNLYTDFNAKVKKGQLLAELDKSLFIAQVNQYKANLQSAQSQLEYQVNNFARQEKLYKVGAIAKADYDNAVYEYNAAKASVASVKAQLATAEKNLSFASIYSPIDGVVLTRSISVGQTVAASFNTPTLFTLAKDITKMQIQANVDEADIGNVEVKQRATFTVDAFLEDVFQGSVNEIRLRPTTSSNVVTYTTIVDAPNNDQKLKPGMTANVTIYTKEVNNALLVPAKALKYVPDASLEKEYKLIPADTAEVVKKTTAATKELEQSKDTTTAKMKDSTIVIASQVAYVWVLQGNQLIQKRIRTGLNDDAQVEVLEGLTLSDEVVTGSTEVSSGTPAAATNSSPFMPKRPGGSSGGKKK